MTGRRTGTAWGVLAVACCLVVPVGANAGASLTIYESALNAYSEHLGAISGTGTESAVGLVGGYQWQVSNITFNITPSGITYQGDLTAAWPMGEWNVLSYATTVSGTAEVSVTNDMVSLSIPSLSFPLAFDVPFVGTVTLLTVTTTLPQRFTTPISAVRFTQAGIAARPQNLSVQYLNGAVRVSSGVLMFKP